MNVLVRRNEADPTFVPADLPEDAPVVDVAVALADKLGMPGEQNGQPLVYYFLHKEGENVVLRGDETFRQANVQTGHHLTLMSEPTGGGA